MDCERGGAKHCMGAPGKFVGSIMCLPTVGHFSAEIKTCSSFFIQKLFSENYIITVINSAVLTLVDG